MRRNSSVAERTDSLPLDGGGLGWGCAFMRCHPHPSLPPSRGKEFFLLALAAFGFCANIVLAQSYPSKPIRFVTGGGPDAMARLLGPKMTATWGQQIVIEE